MANYKILEEAIKRSIKANGAQEITGQVLQGILINMLDTLSDGYSFEGEASTNKIPDTSTKRAYLASVPGVYASYGNITVDSGEVAILLFDGSSWKKVSLFNSSALAPYVEVDVSALNADSSFELATAIAKVPQTYRKGGLTIKFIEKSSNEYVMYYNKNNSWSTDVNDWVNLQSTKKATMTIEELKAFPSSVEEAIKFLKNNKDASIIVLNRYGRAVGTLSIYGNLSSFTFIEVFETQLKVKSGYNSSEINSSPRKYWRYYGLDNYGGGVVNRGEWSEWSEMVSKPFEILQSRLGSVVDVYNGSPTGGVTTIDRVLRQIGDSYEFRNKVMLISLVNEVTNKRTLYYCNADTFSNNESDWVEVGKGGNFDELVNDAKRKIQEAVDHAKTIKQGEKGEKGDTGWLGQVNHGTADTTFALTPNVLHVWGVVPQLSITLAPSVPNIINEYMFEFQSPTDTPTNFNRPQSVKWANDYEQPIKANKRYQGSIVNNVMIIVEASV
jgi:hypothetical protein